MPRNRVGKTAFLNFDSDLLTFGFVRFPEKIAKIEQKVIVFFLGRQEDIGPWFCDIRIAIWLTFCVKAMFFFYFSHLQGIREVKIEPKVRILAIYRFRKNLDFSKILKIQFFLLEYYTWWKFHQNWTTFEEVRAQKAPKKGHFMDAEPVRKTLKICNLTTANAIFMKLTTIMYLCDTFNLEKDWSMTHWA